MPSIIYLKFYFIIDIYNLANNFHF